jgi:UDP-N-acetylmuramoyl-L-alanyl-D-glutamate--2,6-diaminopimelate ligase
MRLADLIPAEIGAVGARDAGVEVAGLAYDSRRAQRGTLFFCIPGANSDGHDHAARAVAAGAAALVLERPLGLGVPEVVVDCARAAMGPVAARFHGDPTRELEVVGVTGTNGKTTTAYLVRALLEASGRHCGLLGTVTSVVGGQEHPVSRTTPEAIDLQGAFRAMLEGGDGCCAMEVSSHALELGRAAGVHFTVGIFTNLTQDHLDFHGTMEEYFQAKRRLFVPTPPGVSVINVEDPYGRRLAAEVPGAVTFAMQGIHGEDCAPARTPHAEEARQARSGETTARQARSGEATAGQARSGETTQPRDGESVADYRALGVRCDLQGCRFTLQTPVGTREVALPLPGHFNVANALGALAAVHAMGVDLDTLVAALGRGVRVPGRFEPVDEGQQFAVLVDYAHTPDSLENVLRAAREVIEARGAGEAGGGGSKSTHRGSVEAQTAAPARGRVICVFGAGGDRDRGKRPLMGEIAARLADVVVATSDNPRSEDPEAIIAEILKGAARSRVVGAAPVEALIDRRAAIDRAITLARGGDVVVVAGKGHEQGQEFAEGMTVPFDDVQVAREALRARRAHTAGAAA